MITHKRNNLSWKIITSIMTGHAFRKVNEHKPNLCLTVRTHAYSYPTCEYSGIFIQYLTTPVFSLHHFMV